MSDPGVGGDSIIQWRCRTQVRNVSRTEVNGVTNKIKTRLSSGGLTTREGGGAVYLLLDNGSYTHILCNKGGNRKGKL